MVRGMSREMKEVCRKFQEVTGWRIPVIERAGRSVRSIAKAGKRMQEASLFPVNLWWGKL